MCERERERERERWDFNVMPHVTPRGHKISHDFFFSSMWNLSVCLTDYVFIFLSHDFHEDSWTYLRKFMKLNGNLSLRLQGYGEISSLSC